MKLSPKIIVSTLLAFTFVYGPTAGAGMYKWVDDEGEVHYGNSVPPEFAKKERRKLNERGRTVKVYDAAKTPEEIAEAARLETIRLEQERVAAEKARKDHVLLATYSS